MHILTIPMPITYNSSINMAQARVLTLFASLLDASGTCLTVSQPVRKATTGVSDSDDEQLPDPEITPAFSACELWLVQKCYKDLHRAFVSAVEHHFTNAAGKRLFQHFVEFLLLLRPVQTYMPYHSTNPHGVCQPGSSEITHTVPKQHTREAEANGQASSTVERVADFVVFDHTTQLYAIVGEIKSEADEAEGQNIEQMIGVWRKNQRALLGFTCNKHFVLPRVLLAAHSHGRRVLELYSFPKLELSREKQCGSLSMMAELFLAFTSFVDTSVAGH